MQGQLVTGEGAGAQFVAEAASVLSDTLGFRPYHGTLNLDGVADLDSLEAQVIHGVGDENCDGTSLRACRIGGIRAAVIRPFVPGYPPSKTELLAPVELRALFDLEPGDSVAIWPPDAVESAWDFAADPGSLDGFDGIVFDLDGTLVDLAVDWPAVHEEVKELVGTHLDRPFDEVGRRDLYGVAREAGVLEELYDLVGHHEREGARGATSRPLLDTLDDLDAPVGVCTANAVDAAEIALERFDAQDAVDVIVGRETLSEQKPHPAPLERCVEALGIRPGDALYVGDEETDATTAERAETSYLPVDRLESAAGSAPDETDG